MNSIRVRPFGGSQRWLLALLGPLVLLGGCASLPGEGQNRQDPWESFNRQVFEVNEAVDEAAIKPVAQAYQKAVPRMVRTGVTNFFNNIADFWTSANLLAQAKPKAALEMGMRGLVNTFFGIAGVMDVADEMGLERFTVEDVGQTLGYWGVPSGPYMMLPLLGPSTVRDTAGRALDFQESGATFIWSTAEQRNIATGIQVVNTRAQLLNAGRVLEQIALDKYLFLRDAYLARRRSLIYGGNPPDDVNAPAPFRDLYKKDAK